MPRPQGVATAGVHLGGDDVEPVEAQVAVAGQLLDGERRGRRSGLCANARSISTARSASGTSTAVPVR